MRLQRETTGHVRDVESDIFSRPPMIALGVDYDGDTPSYDAPRVPKLYQGIRLRREFNNMSLRKKNAVRKLRKNLEKAAKYLAVKDPE